MQVVFKAGLTALLLIGNTISVQEGNGSDQIEATGGVIYGLKCCGHILDLY